MDGLLEYYSGHAHLLDPGGRGESEFKYIWIHGHLTYRYIYIYVGLLQTCIQTSHTGLDALQTIAVWKEKKTPAWKAMFGIVSGGVWCIWAYDLWAIPHITYHINIYAIYYIAWGIWLLSCFESVREVPFWPHLARLRYLKPHPHHLDFPEASPFGGWNVRAVERERKLAQIHLLCSWHPRKLKISSFRSLISVIGRGNPPYVRPFSTADHSNHPGRPCFWKAEVILMSFYTLKNILYPFIILMSFREGYIFTE